MSKRDWRLFVQDIIEAIEKIKGYIKGYTYEEFINDMKTRDAVVRNLEVIGEAANQIPDEMRDKYRKIPWAQIVSLRNRLTHGYFVIDYRIVWEIIKDELPDLETQIKGLKEE